MTTTVFPENKTRSYIDFCSKNFFVRGDGLARSYLRGNTVAIKINKCGQGDNSLSFPSVLVLLDALSFGRFCSLWQPWLPCRVCDQK